MEKNKTMDLSVDAWTAGPEGTRSRAGGSRPACRQTDQRDSRKKARKDAQGAGRKAAPATRRADRHTTENRRALKDEREAVLLALLSHEREETFSNVLVRRTLDQCGHMSTAERAFIKRLLEGVIERKAELDARIGHYTGKPASRLHPAVHQILRMGIYQIYYMDAVPDSAVCNEAVKLAKKHGPARLSGFVNGVLRNAARDAARNVEAGKAAGIQQAEKGPEMTSRQDDVATDRPQAEKGPELGLPDRSAPDTPQEEQYRKLSLQYSMPEWLVRLWTDQLGAGETEKLLAALMEIRPVSVRLSGRLSPDEREKLLLQWKEAGVRISRGRWLPDCLQLQRTSDLRRLPGFAGGLWTVQDESSMLAVAAAGLTGGETVFDVCAAPGGKSFYAAELTGTGGKVLAFDLTRRKTDRIREGAQLLHLDNISVAERDARIYVPGDEGQADVLLCDLPCSGLGVIGKKRDIKYRASLDGLDSLRALQREILTTAVRYLRSGGILLYTTCTINRAENEENAAWIGQELGLQPEDLAPFLPRELPSVRGNMVQLLPHIHGTDGFFISRFRKP